MVIAINSTSAPVLTIGRHVITPDGEGVVVDLPLRGYRDPATLVKVGFGGPVTVDRARPIPGRAHKPDVVTYLYETTRTYDVADVTLKRNDAPRESVEDFIARKSSPKWKPAPLPKPRKLGKLSEANFEKLMREQGAQRLS